MSVFTLEGRHMRTYTWTETHKTLLPTHKLRASWKSPVACWKHWVRVPSSIKLAWKELLHNKSNFFSWILSCARWILKAEKLTQLQSIIKEKWDLKCCSLMIPPVFYLVLYGLTSLTSEELGTRNLGLRSGYSCMPGGLVCWFLKW